MTIQKNSSESIPKPHLIYHAMIMLILWYSGGEYTQRYEDDACTDESCECGYCMYVKKDDYDDFCIDYYDCTKDTYDYGVWETKKKIMMIMILVWLMLKIKNPLKKTFKEGVMSHVDMECISCHVILCT